MQKVLLAFVSLMNTFERCSCGNVRLFQSRRGVSRMTKETTALPNEVQEIVAQWEKTSGIHVFSGDPAYDPAFAAIQRLVKSRCSPSDIRDILELLRSYCSPVFERAKGQRERWL